MNLQTNQNEKWIGLIAGMVLAFLPSFEAFSSLGDPGHWPLHLGWSLFGIGILGYITRVNNRFILSPILIVWLLLVLWSFIGYFTAPITAFSEWKLSSFRYLGYAGFLFIGINLRSKNGTIHPLISNAIVGFGAIVSIYFLVEFLKTKNGILDPYLISGILGHKNFNASAIAISIPMNILLIYQSSRNKWLLTAILILSLISIALTQTRSIVLAGVLSLSIILLNGWKPNKKIWILITTALLGICSFLSHTEIRERLFDSTNMKIRGVFWSHSIEMAKSSPLSGVGSGQWRIQFPKYGLQGTNPSVAEGITAEVRPHNDFLWILSENGSIGFLIFIIFIIYLWITWLKKSERNISHHCLGATLIIVTVYSFFEFPLERIAVYAPFMLTMGSLVKRENKLNIILHQKWTILIVFGFLSLLAYSSLKAIEGDKNNLAVLKNNANKASDKIQESVLRAQNSWNELDRFGNPLPYFSGMGSMFSEAQRSKNKKFGPKNFVKAENLFLQALEIHPNHVVTIFQLGNLYSYRGQLQEAQKTYENLLKKSPRHPGGQIAYAKTLLKLDKPEAASRILISAFLEERYYQSNNFKNLVTESLRRCPKNTSHKGLITVINDREILSDSQLFQKFQTFQAEKRKRNY